MRQAVLVSGRGRVEAVGRERSGDFYVSLQTPPCEGVENVFNGRKDQTHFLVSVSVAENSVSDNNGGDFRGWVVG